MMMVQNQTKTEKKQVLLKAYSEQWQLKKAIEAIANDKTTDTQLSVLIKLENSYFEDSRIQRTEKEELMKYWGRLLGPTSDFGFFTKPEIGTIFTAGALAGTFLHDVEGTKLAELSAGPYSILRGLGVADDQAGAHIKTLVEGGFMLILRGFDRDLKKFEDTLISLEC